MELYTSEEGKVCVELFTPEEGEVCVEPCEAVEPLVDRPGEASVTHVKLSNRQ